MGMKRPFKPGDRVVVYLSCIEGSCQDIAVRYASVERPGQQTTVKGVECIYVCLDQPIKLENSDDSSLSFEHSRLWVPLKACRHLKPKGKRRRIWASFSATNKDWFTCSMVPVDGWVEFVEVRKK